MSIFLQQGEDKLLISFNYSEDRVKQVKKIPGRRWNQKSKKWVVPDNRESLKTIKEVFIDEVIIIKKGENAVKLITSQIFIKNLIKKVEKELILAGYSSVVLLNSLQTIYLELTLICNSLAGKWNRY